MTPRNRLRELRSEQVELLSDSDNSVRLTEEERALVDAYRASTLDKRELLPRLKVIEKPKSMQQAA